MSLRTDIVRKSFPTKGGSIAYWTSRVGDNAPWIVFLPGLTADHRLFDKQMEYFAGKANCLVWDAPAHYESRPFALDFALDDWARWLRGILETEKIHKPLLVGQSMGGYLSQAYLDLYPDGAAGFISIDSAPLQREYFAGWEISALRHTKLMYLSIPWKMLLSWGSSGTAESAYGRALMGEMMESYGKREYCELAAHGYAMLANAAAADRPYELRCPVQLICGEKDGAGSAKRYNREWAKRTGFPMAWIADAGHNANTDKPEEVNRIIDDFANHLFESGFLRNESNQTSVQ